MSLKESNDFRQPSQRTEKGLSYERFMQRMKAIAEGRPLSDLSKDEAESIKIDWVQANADIVALKGDRPEDRARGMGPGVVHFDEVLTNMSVRYANDEYIGERCMPVVMTGGALGGQYWEYDRRDITAYPDDEINSEGAVNELGANRSRASYALTPRSLKERVDEFTLQNQTAPLDELMTAQAHVLDGLAFNREVRIAAVVSTAGNYSGNTVALAAGDRWDSATGGDPGAVIDTARAAVWSGQGPGRFVLAMSLAVYNVLKRHPKILDTFKYGGSAPAFATRERLAEYFEVDEILVGKARKDTANINQAVAYSRIWSDVVALLRVSTAPTLNNAAFGYCVQDKATLADMWFDRAQGGKGCYITRATRADQEKVVSGVSGYLVTTPIL